MTIVDDTYLAHKVEVLARIVDADPILRRRKGLHRFYWQRLITAAGGRPDNALAAILAYLADIASVMAQPVLHLWGETGTGKTHLGVGLAAYLMLNHWSTGFGPDDQYDSFAYVDWPYFMQTQLDDEEPMAVNWGAKILLLDDIDVEPPIPRSGDTFRLNRLHKHLKHRLEQVGQPTLILTRHSISDLERFLATNARGEVANAQAKEWATRITMLIGSHTLARGRTYGSDLRREITHNPQYLQQVLNPLIDKQNIHHFFPQANSNGIETRF